MTVKMMLGMEEREREREFLINIAQNKTMMNGSKRRILKGKNTIENKTRIIVCVRQFGFVEAEQRNRK